MSEIFGMADAYKAAQSRSEYGMSTMNMDISVVIDMANEIESLRAQLDAQSGEAVPDYLVTLRAMQLFDGEYVGQSRAPLWDWAYNKAAQEGEK